MATLGQQLRELRLRRGLTPDEISHETHIPTRILLDLEDDDYSRFDSLIYIKSFLANYSKFLGLDLRPVLQNLSSQGDLLQAESIFKRTHTPLEDTVAPKPIRERRMPIMLAPICVALLGFVAYCLYALCTQSALPFQPASQVQATPVVPLAEPPTPASALSASDRRSAESDDSPSFPVSSTDEPPLERPLADLDLQASSSLVIDLPEMAGQPTALLP